MMPPTHEQLLLQRAADSLRRARERIHELETRASEPLAIVGMACRLPGGVESPADFWQLLCEGRDGVREIPASRWGLSAQEARAVPVRWAGVVEQLEALDARLFGLSELEVAHLDPQQRLLLELVWSALEDGCIGPAELARAPAALFVGATTHDFLDRVLGAELPPSPFSVPGASASFLAGRAAHVFGFSGPSMVVDTACSSSLVALHLACEALRCGDCALAIVAGVNAILSAETMAKLASAQALSPNGKCRTFDAGANGFVRGEGGGALVLKRLGDARRDGHPIWATVRGTAINHDGSTSGLTQPSPIAQAQVMASALRAARVEARALGYVETHGTGTPLGDPVEIAALRDVLDVHGAEGACWLGAAKTAIGHLEAAAGVVSVIKTALVLRHARIPPNLHFTRLNPRIDLTDSRLRIPTAVQEWDVPCEQRLAGVSSFGLSGTNAHAVMGAVPHDERELAAPEPLLLPLSADSAEALRVLAERWAEALEQVPHAPEQACRTAALGRFQLPYRIAVAGRSGAELAAALRAARPARLRAGDAGCAFVYSGQVAPYAGAARVLAQTQPAFREALERAAAWLSRHASIDLHRALNGGADQLTAAVLQPALFAVQVALTELLASLGVRPSCVMGHSLGEYAAAYAAGVLTWEDGLRLLVARGRLMDELPEAGAMLAVELGPEQAQRWLARAPGGLSIAAINAADRTVFSGARAALEQLAQELLLAGVRARPLPTTHGFHSRCVEPMLDRFERELQSIAFKPPARPWVSNLSGQLSDGQAPGPSYWRRHTREPVQFMTGVATLRALAIDTFVEIGLHPVLSPLLQDPIEADTRVVPTLRKGVNDALAFARTLGALYEQGFGLDFVKLFGARGRLARMPTYPFQRRVFTLPSRARARATRRGSHPLLSDVLELATGGAVYSAELSAEQPSWLGEHRIHGDLVVPGAALLELAAAAARHTLATEAVELRDVWIERALLLPEQERVEVQIQVAPDGSAWSWSLHARAARGRESWQQHARGRLGALSGHDSTPSEWARHQAQAEERDPEHYYRELERLGLGLGARFRGLRRLWSTSGGALAELSTFEDEDGGYGVHPATLDAALQALGAAMYTADLERLHVPTHVERVCFFRRAVGPLRSLGTIEGERGDALVSAHVRLETQDGQAVLLVSGLALQRLDGRLGAPVARVLQRVTWHVVPESGPNETHVGTYAVLAHTREVAEELAQPLRARGGSVAYVPVPEPETAQAWERWFEANPQVGTVLDARALSALSGPVCELTLGAQRLLAGAARLRTRTRLAFLTTGAVAQRDEPLPSEPAQAALWGLVRSAHREHPELVCQLLDLDRESATLSALPAALARTPAQDLVPGLLLRAGVLHRAVFEPWTDSASAPAFAASTAGAYLISGGLGGLGLRLARWLAERGARHLILLTRSEPGARLAELSAGDARVDCVQVDVADEPAIRRALRQIGAPVCGVFHLAGRLEDALLANQSREHFETVFAPKLQGAEALARATSDQPLQCFVAFSSVAALFGAPGQANYAAANAALEAWIMKRRQHGQVGTCIQLAPVRELGMAASSSPAQRAAWLQAGVRPLSVDDVLRGVERALVSAAPTCVIADLTAAPAPSRERPWLKAELEGAAPGSRPHLLLQRLQRTVAAALAEEVHAIDPERPLMDMGIDSLTALELRNQLNRALGMSLSTSQLFDSASLSELTRDLLQLLNLDAAEPAERPASHLDDLVVARGESPELDIHLLFESKLAQLDAEEP